MNNDLISRKWLTDAIRNRRTYLSYEDAKDVIDLIDNAPSVEEKSYAMGYQDGSEDGLDGIRPQGEWNEIQAGMFACPFCGARPHKDFKNFCAKCGAKMRKGGAE